jgi:hypothetical protein
VLVAGLWGLLATGVALSADAEPLRSSEVQVRLAGRPAQAAAIEEALYELLAREGLHGSVSVVGDLDPVEVMRQHPEDERLLARVAVNVSDRGFSSIVLVDTRRQRVLLRQVPTHPGVDQVAAEEAAHIVASSLRAMKDGASIGVERAEAIATLASSRPAAEPKRPPAPTLPSPAWEVAVAAAGGAAIWTDEQVAVPAIAGSLTARRAESRWGGELGLDYSTLHAGADPVSLRLSEGGAALQVAFFWGTHVVVAGGPGVHLTRVAPGSSAGAADVSLSAPHWRMAPLFRLSLRLEQRIGGPWTLFGTLMGDAVLDDVRYTVERAGETQNLLHPWLVRPAALIGALVTFGR